MTKEDVMRLAGSCPNCGHTRLMTWGVGVACGYCMGYWPPDRLCQDGLPVGVPGILHDQVPPRPLRSERAVQLGVTACPDGITLEGLDGLDLPGQCVAMVTALRVARQVGAQIAEGSDFGPASLGAMMRDLDAALEPVEQLLVRTLGAAGIEWEAAVTWTPPSGARPWL